MIRVRVPATSANIGPGFDSLGIALNIYNEYEFSIIERGILFEGIEEKYANDDNIILIAMKKAFKKYNFNYGGIKIKIITQDIPVSRGLGSSSSCIVAGLVGAFKLMNKDISKEELFDLATDIEGHPDNVAPAIFGGMIVSVMEDGHPLCNTIDVKDGIKFVALIPDFHLATKKARSVLPQSISFKDGVYNVGRVALLVSCFANGNYKLLKTATQDRFHEPYRSELIYGYYEMNNLALQFGALGCFISGAGPTLMAIIEKNNLEFYNKIVNYVNNNKLKWTVKSLELDKQGAVIVKEF